MTDARPTAAYWEAGAASNKDEEPPPEELENLSDDEAGGQGQRHRGEEGRMGKPSSKQKSGLYAMKGPKDAFAATGLPHSRPTRKAGSRSRMASATSRWAPRKSAD